jgi:hypothetical protein
MTVVLRQGPELISRYREWLKDRGYTYETIDRFIRVARRLERVFPAGIPLDSDRLQRVAGADASTEGSRRSNAWSARRFYEFLEHVALSGGDRA